jgi:hypothetical protein
VNPRVGTLCDYLSRPQLRAAELDRRNDRAANGDNRPKHSHSLLHNFVRKRRRLANMEELAAQWGLMSVEQKAEFREDGVPQAPQVVQAPPCCAPPWPHVGDDVYPVSLQAMPNLALQVSALSSAWRARIGADVVRPQRTLDEPPVRLCGEVWGVGRCLRLMPVDELTHLQILKRRLGVWHDIHKRQSAKFDTLWGQLPLY